MRGRIVVIGYMVMTAVLVTTLTGCARVEERPPGDMSADQIERSSGDTTGIKHLASAGLCRLYRVRVQDSGGEFVLWSVCSSSSSTSALSR